MRWLQLLTASLLPFAALAAKKAPADRFNEFHSKSLTGPLKLDDALYTQLTKAPRDYSAVLLLTARGARFGCVMCREFQPEWELLAKSWTKGDKQAESRVLFGTLDFEDGKNTFQSVQDILPSGHVVIADEKPVDAPNCPRSVLFSPYRWSKREGWRPTCAI